MEELIRMARFTDEWLQELLNKNDIVDVIGGYLPLSKRGANYWAKCPWHNETRPSFSVTPSKQMFYCFSCRKGGSVINFIMEYEKVSYREAVQKLAERVGMQMPESSYDPNYKKNEAHKLRLKQLMVDTAHYFHDNLKKPAGQSGLSYLNQRGIISQVNKFGLGYALPEFDDLVKFLKKKGYTVKEMLDSGVAKQKGPRIYDTFRDRVMFPILDVTGSVIAFGGRIISEGDPKYLNSPETALFNKRKNLYNLFRVKKERDLKAIILAEGYMDVVSLAAAGINVAVASLGTALSDDQARLIKRFVSKVYLNYDGDDPGIKAALRACDILQKSGLSVFVIRLPEGMDPDELIKKYGIKKYYEYVKSAVPAFEFKLNMLKRDFDLNSKEDKYEYAKSASSLIRELPDGVEKERYIDYLSKETGIYRDTISREVSENSSSSTFKDVPYTAHQTDITDPEEKLISLLIQYPAVLYQTDIIKKDVFGNELYRKIFEFISDRLRRGISVTCAEILSVFASEGLNPDIIARFEIPPNASKLDEIRSFLQEIRIRTANNNREKILEEIKEAQGTQRIELLRQLADINKEIQSLKANKI